MTFTNKNLSKLLKDCETELNSLGFFLFPITKIAFSKRLKNAYGYCRMDKGCIFDPSVGRYKDITLNITIMDGLSKLDSSKEHDLKTLVMHEAIHAIDISKSPDAPENTGEEFPGIITHGVTYDLIKKRVEKELGYHGIDDENHHDFNLIKKEP